MPDPQISPTVLDCSLIRRGATDMPIRAEDKHRYPPNWKQIRAAVLKRAGHRCEFCGVPNYAYRTRQPGQWTEDAGQAKTWVMDGERVTRIVLTIAHLDHTPEHCDTANLAALCQRCHLRYDIPHHRQTFYKTRRNGKAIRDLFDDDPLRKPVAQGAGRIRPIFFDSSPAMLGKLIGNVDLLPVK